MKSLDFKQHFLLGELHQEGEMTLFKHPLNYQHRKPSRDKFPRFSSLKELSPHSREENQIFCYRVLLNNE